MSAIDPRAGQRFLAGFVLLAVLSGITLGIAKVTTTLYALSLQATPLELALLGAAQSVGILAVSLPVGLMVDRYGARRLFIIGSLLVTVLYALVPAWGQLWFLLACTTAVSFAMPLRFISLSAVFMGELARIGEARAGWFRGSHMMGMFLIGPALAAGIVGAIGYAGSYWLIAGLLLITAAMAPLAFPGERGRKAPGPARRLSWRSIGSQLGLLKTEAALRSTCVSEFFAMALNMFYAFFIVVLAIEVFGFSSGLYDGIDMFAVATDQLVFHRKIVFRVNRTALGNQIAHVTVRCQDFKVGTQVFFQGFGFGGRLHNQ